MSKIKQTNARSGQSCFLQCFPHGHLHPILPSAMLVVACARTRTISFSYEPISWNVRRWQNTWKRFRGCTYMVICNPSETVSLFLLLNKPRWLCKSCHNHESWCKWNIRWWLQHIFSTLRVRVFMTWHVIKKHYILVRDTRPSWLGHRESSSWIM